MSKKPKRVDPNIITALERLKWPLPSFRNTQVTIRAKCKEGKGAYHVANQRHYLKVADVSLIPSILKAPYAFHTDPRNKKHFNYYGKRKGGKRGMFIKVVTMLNRRNKGEEFIVTIYPTQKLK